MKQILCVVILVFGVAWAETSFVLGTMVLPSGASEITQYENREFFNAAKEVSSNVARQLGDSCIQQELFVWNNKSLFSIWMSMESFAPYNWELEALVEGSDEVIFRATGGVFDEQAYGLLTKLDSGTVALAVCK